MRTSEQEIGPGAPAWELAPRAALKATEEILFGAGESTKAAAVASPRTKLRLLLVEDNANDAELALHALREGGFDTVSETAQTPEDFLERVRNTSYDIVLADYRLPSWNGMETVELLRSDGLDIPVVLVSGSLGELKAVECIKQGAADYVLKDHLLRLPQAVRRAIQERRLREERRKAQEDLARSNRDLEQFAYVASHDLQEPLRMVAAYTQLLAERYQGKLDANADKYIHYAVDGALRMQTLVQDLLAFSRVGRQGSERQMVSVASVVETSLQDLRAMISEIGAKVECGPLPSVIADPVQLSQVFQNLIGNAIKFRGDKQPHIRIAAEQQGREWVFSVTDNGIGIDPEYAELIFVIFKRLHTLAEYRGNGIGLAICKKIVEQHDGRIWVESPPGQGASFKFTLRAREGAQTPDARDEKKF
jgi:signal transduction histidine kinase